MGSACKELFTGKRAGEQKGPEVTLQPFLELMK
jgi:hypothetical protein